ncbi:hypothetical protein BYT27DRAFT_7199262, partial [Phlegmacium glaucopus]
TRAGVLIAASVITVLTIDSEESYAFRYLDGSVLTLENRITGQINDTLVIDEDFLSFTEQNGVPIYARSTTFPSVVQTCHRVSVCPLDHILYTKFSVQGLGIYQVGQCLNAVSDSVIFSGSESSPEFMRMFAVI